MVLPIGAPVVDPGPRQSPDNRTLTGKYVCLQAIDPETQAQDLFAAANGSEEREQVWTYLPNGGPFADAMAMQQWLEMARQFPGFVFYVVQDLLQQRSVGMCSYCNIDVNNQHLELGYIWYDPDVQRSKINTETIYLLLCEAFDVLAYRRVEWKCDALNQASRDAALRLGFRFEGIFRQHMIVNGRNRDTAWFAMLDHDWPQIKANIERWLYSDGNYFSLTEANQV